MKTIDQGVVMRHGDGPMGCDLLGARDVWVWQSGGRFYMHYDGAGEKGWLACLAESDDLVHWNKRGAVLDFGKTGEDDSASASYGVTHFDGSRWHLFYLGTPNASPPPDHVPMFPYLTMKAHATDAIGPWTKDPAIVPFRTRAGTYYSITASPGQVIRHDGEYLMFFSATMAGGTAPDGSRPGVLRTLGIARTRDLNGTWVCDPEPILPSTEQIENSSLYFEPANQTWFLFTNHIGIGDRHEYTDAAWVYWSRSLEYWNPANKAVVLDGNNCMWSKRCIGLPAVMPVGNRLAVLYDAPGGTETSHMRRDIGLAWIELPLNVPS